MTNPASGARLTGGQLNVAGILYQMCVSLSQGLDTVFGQVATGGGRSTVALTVEPFNGGDVQVHTGRSHIVQVKMKTAAGRWSNHQLITKVLPDLFKAATAGSDDTFEFVTDNDAGCDGFREFLEWFRDNSVVDAQGRPPTFSLGRGGKKVSGAAMLSAIHEVTGTARSAKLRVAALLNALTITRRSETELLHDLDTHLEVLAEAPEEIVSKRSELIGNLIGLGRSGQTIRMSQLLRDAQLDPRRFLHVSQLPSGLATALGHSFPHFGYDMAVDVRAAPDAPTQAVTMLRGQSGLGKTWQLCAMAQAMATAGRSVVLLRATNLQDLQARILDLVWHTNYGRQTTLAAVTRRLRPHLGDARGVWLTVLVDDLNDPSLGRALLEQGWAAHGIDIVLSAQPATADWLRQSYAIAEVEVQEFTVAELSRYLTERGVDQTNIAPDVFALLQKPVLAKLYCELEHALIPRSETEYELLELFWKRAASHRETSAGHPFDLDRLQLVVGQLLDASPSYPWPPSSFIHTLDDGGVFRLVEVGIVELDGDRRLSMTHDRLLNWAMAAYLATQARDRQLPPPDLVEALRKTETIKTVTGVQIGRRLGYVLMDLVWMLLAPDRWTADQVATFLLGHLRSKPDERQDQRFFTETLSTLGLRGAALLGAIVRQDLDEEQEQFWRSWSGRALRKVARSNDEAVRKVALELFESDNAVHAEVGLEVLAQVPAPEIIDRLFELTMTRTANVQAAEDDRRFKASDAKSRAFEALVTASRGNIDWLNTRLASEVAPDRLIQLLWVLLQLDSRSGPALWKAHRERLFQLIPATDRVLPQGVRTFADSDDLPRLQIPSPGDADGLLEAVTFDALARLEPAQAIRLLEDKAIVLDNLGLLGTEHWWLPGLFFRINDPRALGRALRARFVEDEEDRPFNVLASLFTSLEVFIDDETTDVLLDALESMISAAGPVAPRVERGRRLIGLLAGLKTITALERVAARRGSRLEDALAELSEGAQASSSRIVDRDAQAIARLLALMGGAGFDRMVAAQLRSSGTTTRDYGLRHAVWSTSPEIAARLDAMAREAQPGSDENYALMQALAAHGCDVGLERLISLDSPVYTHAVDIRQARGGDTSALLESIRAKASSDVLAENLQAVDLAHFASADDVLPATAPLIARAEPGDELTKRLLLLHYHRNRYEAALLPRIGPLLNNDDDIALYARLHLALNGDEAGRAALLPWLARNHSPSGRRHAVEVALFLTWHEDSRPGAIAALTKLRDHAPDLGDSGAELLEVLAAEGDRIAATALQNLSFDGQTRTGSGAVRAILATQGGGTRQPFEAAKRLFGKSGRLDAARALLKADQSAGLTHLVNAYPSSPPSRKAAIARTLRWDGDRGALEFALQALATSDDSSRTTAAELAGWLPGSWNMKFLKDLVEDRTRGVETAALNAATSRAANAEALRLIAQIPHVPKPTQWALLSALCEVADPHILAHHGDELSLWPLLDSLPREFMIETERLIDRRAKALARDLERDDRRAA